MWQAGATLHRGARASHCRGLSLRSTGSRRAGSVVVAHGVSCSAACGILPDQGSNPCPLHGQADSQPLRHQGSPLSLFFNGLSPHIEVFVQKVHFILLFFKNFLAVLCSMWDPSSLTKDRTLAPALEAQSPNHWTIREVPLSLYISS